MSHHYLHPEDEPRRCDGGCDSEGYLYTPERTWCAKCRGTGKLGNPDAKPEIELDCRNSMSSDQTEVWYWVLIDVWDHHGPFDTEAEALESARKSLTQETTR